MIGFNFHRRGAEANQLHGGDVIRSETVIGAIVALQDDEADLAGELHRLGQHGRRWRAGERRLQRRRQPDRKRGDHRQPGGRQQRPGIRAHPSAGDGDWTTSSDNDYGDLRLQSGSPAINVGANAANSHRYDLSGAARIRDGNIDLGAYEWRSPIYVDADASSGLNDGSSWTNAYTDLQTALTAVVHGDTIWVAEGSYQPGTTAGHRFELVDGVALYGGFNATESRLSERDLDSHKTILSGGCRWQCIEYWRQCGPSAACLRHGRMDGTGWLYPDRRGQHQHGCCRSRAVACMRCGAEGAQLCVPEPILPLNSVPR